LKVIIPAAGPIAPGYGFPRNPKPICLYHYKGEILLERQIRIFQSVGLNDIRIVVGYRKELIENFIREKGLNVELAENLAAAKDAYVAGGWATFLVSLRKGLEGVDDDVIIIMSDVYLTLEGIKTLLEDKHKCVTLRDNHGPHVFKIAREFLPEFRQLTGIGHSPRLCAFCREKEETIYKAQREHDIDYYRQTDEQRMWATSHLGIDWTHWCGLSSDEKKQLLRSKGIKIEIYYDEFLIKIDGYYGLGKNYDVYGVEFDVEK